MAYGLWIYGDPPLVSDELFSIIHQILEENLAWTTVRYAHVLWGCGGAWVNLDGGVRSGRQHASVHARLLGVCAALCSWHRCVRAGFFASGVLCV
jgi:hypothetical protein